MSKWATSILYAVLAILCPPRFASASDWPTYLRDNARSGASSEQLKLPLQERWTYSSPGPPQRAWSGPEGRTIEGKELRDRVKFDDVFQVAEGCAACIWPQSIQPPSNRVERVRIECVARPKSNSPGTCDGSGLEVLVRSVVDRLLALDFHRQ